MKWRSTTGRLAVFAALLPWGALHAQSPPGASAGGGSSGSPLDALPITFVENQGQWEGPARFAVNRGPLKALFEPAAMLLMQRDSAEGVFVRLAFEGTTGEAWIEGEQALPGVRNYFVGDAASWRTDVLGYASIRYHGLYPGVDLRVRAQAGHLEYDLLLERASDLERVVVRCEGVDCLEIDTAGNLVLATTLGDLTQPPPLTWQVRPDGEREPVVCRYRPIDGERYGFEAPGSDPELPLVVDPGLQWSTFLGAGGSEIVQDVALVAGGDVVACGQTNSVNFPKLPGVSAGAFQVTKGEGLDAYVVRMDPEETGSNQLVYATFLGGAGDDRAHACSVDEQGLITLVGRTESAGFPTTANAYDTTHNGGQDVFVSRLDPALTGSAQLLYSTFAGDSQDERGNDLHVDAAGVVTVFGWTQSPLFPTSAGAYDTTHNGGSDAFVLRLDPTQVGSAQLLYSTLLGGASNDYMYAGGQLHVADDGLITVAGTTESIDFPTLTGAYRENPLSGLDGFVSRLDPGLAGPQQLVASTYIGGNSDENLNAVAVDTNGIVTVAGNTVSTDFPTTPLAFQPVHAGGTGNDAYVARLDPDLTTLLYSTFLGGTDADIANGLSADGSGLVTVVGSVASSDFPTTPGAYEETFQGGNGFFGPYDSFVARFDPSLNELHYSSFFGGADSHEFAYTVAVDNELAAVIGGVTQSSDFPTTADAFDTLYATGDDGFLTRLDLLPTGAQTYGASSPGCAGSLAIGVDSWPQAGNLGFGLFCASAPASVTGFLALTLAPLATPLDVLGVDVWVDPTTLVLIGVLTSDSAGYAEYSLPLPASVPVGASLSLQFLWPSACGDQGFAASNALTLTIQP